MVSLIDTNLWIDLVRPNSSSRLKEFVLSKVLLKSACIAELIAFEVLRQATPREYKYLSEQFETLPSLPIPADLWTAATALGQDCRRAGVSPASIDLLIAAIAIHHDATLITFDDDFTHIAKASRLRVELLKRPG